METIIVTLTNTARLFFMDLELPANVQIGKLKADLTEALNEYEPGMLFPSPDRFELVCSRLGKQLSQSETLAESGIWNGDYLIVTEV